MHWKLALRRTIGWGLRRSLYALQAGQNNRGVRTLMYHSVDESGSPLSVSPSELRQHLNTLKQENWRTLRASDYLERLRRGAGPAREVFITFDDAYENFYTAAAPIFKEHGFTATIFVPTDFIGGRPEWLERDRKAISAFLSRFPFSSAQLASLNSIMNNRLMSRPQIQELSREGFDFASHSAGHHFLDSLHPDALSEDLARSKKVLKELGQDLPMICYPYGVCNHAVQATAKEQGFEAGFVATYNTRNNPLAIGRAGIDGSLGIAEFKFALSPALDVYTNLLAGRSKVP